MPKTREVVSGARAKLMVNGTKQFGYATGVSATESTSLTRVDVLGDIDSVDIVPTGRAVSVQADSVRILNESLSDIGVAPRGGTTEVITSSPFSLDLHDPITDVFLFRVSGCRLENQSIRTDRGGITMQNASFQGIRLTDQTGQ